MMRLMSERVQGLISEWNKLTSKQKIALIATAPDVYYAAARLVRYEEALLDGRSSD